MLIVAELHSDPSDGDTPVLALAKFTDAVLVPSMNVQSAAGTSSAPSPRNWRWSRISTTGPLSAFDRGPSDATLRRGLDKARRDLSGEEQASAGILKCPGACHVYSVTVQIVQWEKKTG
ncbi:hypothetical protein ACYG9R_17215 [Mesorhizobium sp. RSR565B]|uniref:hypothetical protein n=1 Tax=unclassified Mesorhizobium TaxID=325217 RepID=UPI000429CA8C|nr:MULTISPECIES: hypothetical protein [unclassified Mesorhizobium]WJI61809.1 hypothetical protein NLY43_24870 [Mesorhizobium sp. C416B]